MYNDPLLRKVMNISRMLCSCGNDVFMQRLLRTLRSGWQAWNIHLPVLLNFLRKHRMQQFPNFNNFHTTFLYTLSRILLPFTSLYSLDTFLNFFIGKLSTFVGLSSVPNKEPPWKAPLYHPMSIVFFSYWNYPFSQL